MPTTSQAIVFTPQRYQILQPNVIPKEPTVVRELPTQQLHPDQTASTNDVRTDLSNLKQIDTKATKLSLLAKIIIGVVCTTVAIAAVSTALGIVLGGTTTTTRSTSTTTTIFYNTTTTTATTSTSATTTTTTSTTSRTTSTSSTTSSTSTSSTSSTSTTSTTTTTMASLSAEAFWSFDNNLRDANNNFNANTSGNPSFVSSYLGTGAALSLTRTSSQYAAVINSQLLFNSTSFTIEAWIYPISITTADFGIFGQCHAATTNMCMFFILRNYKLCCGFWNNDLLGTTNVAMNTWSHVACVYDLSAQTQTVYLNGVANGNRSSPPYVGSVGHTTIGVGYLTPPGSNFFNGYLDQMRFSLRAKNATEMLNSGSLVVYYPFTNGSVADSGPNGINSSVTGTVTSVTGRVNEGLRFYGNGTVSPSSAAFFVLGVSGQAFTMALWIQPMGTVTQSTVVHVTHSSGWCVGFITIQSTRQLFANFWQGSAIAATGPLIPWNGWTHVGYTYSSTNGIRLYINGTYFSTSGAFNSVASGASMSLSIGSNFGASSCSPGYGGYFNGVLDEFYLYSRELTAAQIAVLANP